tara:strand:- start:50 stop:397 length:348 start_codon:yes stop_codon:yes gene_type:complete
MNAFINVTELACDLASKELENHRDEFPNGDPLVYDKNNNSSYCDKAQDLFNNYNDDWEEEIMKSEVYKNPKDKLYHVRELLKELIDIGADYGVFQSAQITNKNLKKAYKLLEGLS